MVLTKEQQAILDGARGETMARVMKTLVAYGEAFDAERMVPVTGAYGHTVISFGLGLGIMKPVYELYDKILAENEVSRQPFSADPRPADMKNVPANFLQNIVFDFMYSQQKRCEEQLKRFGILSDDAYTCTCYLPQVGNTPKKGEVLSWAESSAVVYANSVLGARCNRNSGILELFGSIAGCVPEFGLLTDEGRRADWVVELKTETLPDAQLFGSAVGMKVLEQVPYVKGLDRFLGTELTDEACTYLKDFGAATASNGSVGLYHIENLTPEAVEQGEALIRDGLHGGRRRDRAGEKQPSLHLEGPGRQTEALLPGLPAHVAQPAHRLDEAGGDRARGGRAEEGRHPHGVHGRPGGAQGLRGDGVRQPPQTRGRRHKLYLSADVHEQPPLQVHARHHLLQQAAHLFQRALLPGGGDPAHDHRAEIGGAR